MHPRLLTTLLLLLLLLLPLASGWAQPVTGRVVARGTGEPLPQTTVRLDGQAVGTSTDEAGRFQLALPAGRTTAQLIFSHLGYQSRTVPAQEVGSEVKLEEQTYQIGEVVVAYESLRKLLLREWRIDDASLDVAGQRLLAGVALKDSAKAAKLAKNPEAIRAVMKMARYTFQPDGIIKVKVLLLGSKGQWELDEADRKLLITNREGKEAAVVVTELSAARLVLHHPETNLPDVMYVPVK